LPAVIPINFFPSTLHLMYFKSGFIFA
jgi:hypothetical protein